jgi:hypothetical protein
MKPILQSTPPGKECLKGNFYLRIIKMNNTPNQARFHNLADQLKNNDRFHEKTYPHLPFTRSYFSPTGSRKRTNTHRRPTKH